MLQFQKKITQGWGQGDRAIGLPGITDLSPSLLVGLESLKILCDVAKGHIGPVCHQ